jgi:hypothetical protein
MTNDECRRNDEARMTNSRVAIGVKQFGVSDIRTCFVIRHSDFVIHYGTPAGFALELYVFAKSECHWHWLALRAP